MSKGRARCPQRERVLAPSRLLCREATSPGRFLNRISRGKPMTRQDESMNPLMLALFGRACRPRHSKQSRFREMPVISGDKNRVVGAEVRFSGSSNGSMRRASLSSLIRPRRCCIDGGSITSGSWFPPHHHHQPGHLIFQVNQE